MAQLRGNFSDLVLEDALPVLEKIIEDRLMEFPMEHEQVFNVGSMDRGIIQHTQVSGYFAPGTVAEGAEYPQDEQEQGFDKTYTAVKRGFISAISQELLDDAKDDVFRRRPDQLVRAMNESIKISAAGIFNNGFGDTGPDGVSLFNTAHPLAKAGAGTSSNTLAAAADLSLSSLEDLVTVQRKTLDNAGKKVLVKPDFLIVPPELEFLAHELLDSTMKPQATDDGSINETNAINSMRSRYGMRVVVMDYLTDDDAFFIAAGPGSNELWWYWRDRPEVSSDTEFKSDVGLIKIRARWDVSYSDWRGVAGSPGV